MRLTSRGLLPTLLVLNGLMSLILAWRATTLRRQVQIWDLRAAAWSELGPTERGRHSGPLVGPEGKPVEKPPSLPSETP